MNKPVPWGTHVEFVQRYETYLVATLYGALGRAALVENIGSELQSRGVTRLLDCAAGTGFPALDLALAKDDLGLDEVHVCDGDRVMLRELNRQAKERGIDLGPMNPRLRPARTPRQALDDLVINWRDLRVVREKYDYVMCRGNSLAYADTWGGNDQVSPLTVIGEHLAHMAAKVEPGGYLHVDAPWILAPRDGPLPVLDSPELVITEQIKDHHDHREWLLHFLERHQPGRESKISFRRLSSHLTIHHVRQALQELNDFEDTKPFQLRAERRVYGTIIARKSA